MKKFIITFFSILLIALTSVGGGLLLSACDNSSYSENVGGGVGDSTNEDVNTPSDETPTDDPNGENENLGSEENNDENQDDIEAQGANFSVRVQAYLATGEILSYSTLNSRRIYAGKFSISWHEGDGKWGNGDPKDWGNTPTTIQNVW